MFLSPFSAAARTAIPAGIGNRFALVAVMVIAKQEIKVRGFLISEETM